jgi:hypothetical protein
VIEEKTTNLGTDRRTAIEDATLEGGRDLGRKGNGESDLTVRSNLLGHASVLPNSLTPLLNRAGMRSGD